MRPLKMDSKYTMEERGDNYTLTVTNVRQPDLGDYTCTAVNKISEQQAIVILTGNKKILFFMTLDGEFDDFSDFHDSDDSHGSDD